MVLNINKVLVGISVFLYYLVLNLNQIWWNQKVNGVQGKLEKQTNSCLLGQWDSGISITVYEPVLAKRLNFNCYHDQMLN